MRIKHQRKEPDFDAAVYLFEKQKHRGRNIKKAGLEFGEQVLYLGRIHRTASWHQGSWLSFAHDTNEHMVASVSGVTQLRTVRRMAGNLRWDAARIATIAGTPWKPGRLSGRLTISKEALVDWAPNNLSQGPVHEPRSAML